MPVCFFASDLHGRPARYEALFAAIAAERPAAVFLGGDLLPHPLTAPRASAAVPPDFIADYLAVRFLCLREALGADAPRVFVILGNDDARAEETAILAAAARGAWEYVHGRVVDFGAWSVCGYACVPPTPFRLKDWERYDVSRYVDPGCLPPEAGLRTVPVPEHEIIHGTIAGDLADLLADVAGERAIILLHTPPYDTRLDRAALDGRMIDHVPLDPHIGSIAVRRFIEARQPLLTLHGHVHESTRLTGEWRERLGRTWMFQGAHDGPQLALVRFDPERVADATRELLPPPAAV
ncbi:MAG: metallophosphoesterase family protein [Candidatus Krumholzibacteriia bacterium]